jgi:hypothetical protein
MALICSDWASSISFTAGGYFTTLGRCGSPSRMQSAASRIRAARCSSPFTTIRAGSHIHGGSYNRLPRVFKKPFVIAVSAVTHTLVIIKYSIKLKPMAAIGPLLSDRRERGMSGRSDAVDWIGGFPYEFCTFDTLATYLAARGFSLTHSRRDNSHGCNELVLQRTSGIV